MAVLFDPKGGSDVIQTGSTVTTPADWTAYMWFRRASAAEGAQLFAVTGGTYDIDLYYSFSTTNLLLLDRGTDGTGSRHTLSGANAGITYSASQWVFIAITQSGRATPVIRTASPVQSVGLATRTVTVSNAGSGTANSGGSSVLYLGNWDGLDYALGGDLAWFGFHNVILTAGEIEEAMWRGMTLRGRVLTTPLESIANLYDLSGNGHTLTNSGASDTAAAAPPVTPLWLPTAEGWVPVEDLFPTLTAGAIAQATSGTTVTPTLPAHQADDILIAQAMMPAASDLTISGGWTVIGAAENNANLSTAWWWMRAASGAESNPTITSSATASPTDPLDARTYRARGATTSGTPFEDATFSGPTTSTTPAGSTVDTTDDDRLVVAFASIDSDSAWATPPPPATWEVVA